MNRYAGAIVDDEGYMVFEFITKFCFDREAAKKQANDILKAWRATHPDGDFFYTLELAS